MVKIFSSIFAQTLQKRIYNLCTQGPQYDDDDDQFGKLSRVCLNTTDQIFWALKLP